MQTRRFGALAVALAALVACSGVADPIAPASAPPAEATPVADAGQTEASAPINDAAPGADASRPCTAPPATFTKILDVAYASGDPAQKLDLYVPDGAGPFPLVLFVHGGGWQTGDKAPTQAMRQATRGYVVASINYRLSGTAKFPAQIYDVKAAIRWLRGNASTHKIDPVHVAAFGPSAGGHLVALLGTSSGVAAMEDLSMGNANQPSNVQAVVDFFGPTDFSKMSGTHLATCPPSEHDEPTSGASLLVGCALPSCPAAVQAANPIAYVTAAAPPFLILHGTADCTVPPNQSELLRDALRNAKVSVRLDLLNGAEHAGPEFRSPKTNAIVDEFLDARLRSCL